MNAASRHAAWKTALLAGFVTQLMLIVFVTAIGLRQLSVTTDKFNQVVDIHMRKQILANTMVITARERTLIMFSLTRVKDPFDRDDLLLRFNQKGSEFVTARIELLNMPLSPREKALIERQRQLIAIAQPIQNQVIDLIADEDKEAAENIVLNEVLPRQNAVMAALSELNAEVQRLVLVASQNARNDLETARFWMFLLSGASLLIGFMVAAVVFFYTTRISREREQLATHDVLTGLPNRALFLDRLDRSLIHARRNGTQVGVMFIDLDRFKRINDTLGHSSGDQLIREVAKRLQHTARADDIVSRLGGDEFVVVVGDISHTRHILQVVEKIQGVASLPYLIAGHELFCSFSIGISVYPDDGTDTSTLLMNADTAMYHAKNQGRNRYQLYNASMNAMAEERLQLETDLHYAIAREEFVFHYQPQINLVTGRVHAVEALMRWNNPDKGLLAPIAFLEMLEETGEIVSVGNRLLNEACAQAAQWHAAGFDTLEVAVNISSKEFWHESLISNVQSALASSGLAPQFLQLELTEGILMGNIDVAIKRILELKALGVSIAIDDFGTGYSSLAHLKRFPLNVLKIDRYFVKDLEHASVNEALVSSILSLSHGLNLDTVAEGVENRHQLDRLQKLGCTLAQGYLLSKPVPSSQILELLQHDWTPVAAGLNTDSKSAA